MNSECSQDTMETVAKNRLVELGWAALSNEAAIAIKSFQTAVGIKAAHVYLSALDSQAQGFWLTGDYQTEGRNCLESCIVFIPQGADLAQAHELIGKFSDQAHEAQAQSYAARIYAHDRPRG